MGRVNVEDRIKYVGSEAFDCSVESFFSNAQDSKCLNKKLTQTAASIPAENRSLARRLVLLLTNWVRTGGNKNSEEQ